MSFSPSGVFAYGIYVLMSKLEAYDEHSITNYMRSLAKYGDIFVTELLEGRKHEG